MELQADERSFTGRIAVDRSRHEGLELGGGSAGGVGPQEATQAPGVEAHGLQSHLVGG